CRRARRFGPARIRTKTSDQAQPVRIVLRDERRTELDRRLQRHRHPEIGRATHALAEELARRDADDREGRTVEYRDAADRLRVGVQLLPPVTVAYDRDRRRGRTLIV